MEAELPADRVALPHRGLYDAIADPADLEVVFAIEALTNPRLRNELGELQLVPPDERISGAGSTPIMAAFTHLNPEGSRFSDGSYGVYYAANDLDTAIAEVSHHRAVFMARTQEPAIDIDLRLIVAPLDARLHDLRGLRRSAPQLYDPDDYSAGRALGRQLREAGSWGVLYHSVRHRGGLCAGAVPAARPEAGTRERAHRAALGRIAHHALVREARAAAAGLTSAAPATVARLRDPHSTRCVARERAWISSQRQAMPNPGASGATAWPSSIDHAAVATASSCGMYSTHAALGTAAHSETCSSIRKCGHTARLKASARCATFSHGVMPPMRATSTCRIDAAPCCT